MSPSGQPYSPIIHNSISREPAGDHAEDACVATSRSPPTALPAAGGGTQAEFTSYPPSAHKFLSYLYDSKRLQKISVKQYCLLPVSTHSLPRLIECPLVAACELRTERAQSMVYKCLLHADSQILLKRTDIQAEMCSPTQTYSCCRNSQKKTIHKRDSHGDCIYYY